MMHVYVTTPWKLLCCTHNETQRGTLPTTSCLHSTIAEKTLNVTGLALEVKLVSTSTAHVTNTYVIQGIITGFCDEYAEPVSMSLITIVRNL